MAPIAVLVVDDHAVFADALQARLSIEPDLRPVYVAYSVAEATPRLSTTPVDVALVDWTLGDGSGLAVAEAARGSAPDTRIVILTATESAALVVDALTAGVRAWLPKTVDSAHLIRVIRGVHAGEIWLAPALLGEVLAILRDRILAPRPDPLAVLTAREREVLQCLVEGLSRPQISASLRISAATLRTHTHNLITKLGAHTALEAVALALRNAQHAPAPDA